MEVGQILIGIFAVLRSFTFEIITVIALGVLLSCSRHKVRVKREKEEEFRGWMLFEVVVNAVLIFFVSFKSFGFLIGDIGGLILAIVILILVGLYSVYFLLAPNNCFFTFVKEGTVKFVVKGDEFSKCLIQWQGYTFDYSKPHPEKWNIIEGEEPWHPLGGLRFYGMWPIWDIHIFRFRWVGVTENGEENPKDEWLEAMLTKDDVYLVKIPIAEDADKLPLDFQVFLTIRIVNPYKAKFVIQRWLEAVQNRIQPLMRQYIAQYRYEELLKMRHEIGGEMWKELQKADLLGKDGIFYRRYGVEVRAIEVRQIEPPDTLRAVTLKKFEAEREAEAIIARAEGEKTAIIRRAEGEAKRIVETFSKIKEFGEPGFLLAIAREAKGKDLPALVLTHHLAAKFQEKLGRSPTEKELGKLLAKILMPISQKIEDIEKIIEQFSDLKGGEKPEGS